MFYTQNYSAALQELTDLCSKIRSDLYSAGGKIPNNKDTTYITIGKEKNSSAKILACELVIKTPEGKALALKDPNAWKSLENDFILLAEFIGFKNANRDLKSQNIQLRVFIE